MVAIVEKVEKHKGHDSDWSEYKEIHRDSPEFFTCPAFELECDDHWNQYTKQERYIVNISGKEFVHWNEDFRKSKNHDYTVPAMHNESRFNSNVLSNPMNEPDQVENKKPHLVVGPVVLSGLTEFSVLSLANNQYL